MSQLTQDYAPATQPYGDELSRQERLYQLVRRDYFSYPFRERDHRLFPFPPSWFNRLDYFYRTYNYRATRTMLAHYANFMRERGRHVPAVRDFLDTRRIPDWMYYQWSRGRR